MSKEIDNLASTVNVVITSVATIAGIALLGFILLWGYIIVMAVVGIANEDQVYIERQEVKPIPTKWINPETNCTAKQDAANVARQMELYGYLNQNKTRCVN